MTFADLSRLMSHNRFKRWRSFVSNLWDDSAIRLIVILTLIVTSLLNAPYYLQFRGLSVEKTTIAILGSAVSTACFFLVLSAHRYVVYLLLPPVLVACATAAYFLAELGVYVNENTLGLVFETTWHEATSLLTPALAVAIAGTTILGVGTAHLLVRRLSESHTFHRLAWAGLLFVAHLTVAVQTRALEVYDPPLGLVTNSYIYFREAQRANTLLMTRKDISQKARFDLDAGPVDDDLTVVFVVGESVRPDHLQLNGYPRETTPNLAKLPVLSFSDVTACATNTRFAVPCMLTRGTRQTPRTPYEETSFLSVFRRLDFETSWLSMQGRFWEALVENEYTVAATAAIASEAETIRYLNASGDLYRSQRLDTELLAPLDAALATPAPRKLIVLHQIGAHFQYASHHPVESTYFKPVCLKKSPRRCNLSALNNSYDNAIRFQDLFLSQTIHRLKEKNALFLYVSDHGESLGEGGQYLHHHGSSEPEQNRVATMVWASDTFKERHPERWKQLRLNQKKQLSHDHVFHTVLDCSGIEIPEVDPEMSLCRNAKERTRRLAPNRLSASL